VFVQGGGAVSSTPIVRSAACRQAVLARPTTVSSRRTSSSVWSRLAPGHADAVLNAAWLQQPCGGHFATGDQSCVGVDVEQVGHGVGKVGDLVNDCGPVLETADLAG
jgi:hypothetical protein